MYHRITCCFIIGGEDTRPTEDMETNKRSATTTDGDGSEMSLNKKDGAVTQSESSGESSSASDSDDR